MQHDFYRESWVEIQLTAIRENVRNFKLRLKEDTKIFAVVKANAYGHGDIQVAKVALDEGAYGLAVALLDEAIKLRKAGITSPILVLGWVRPDAARIACEYDVALTVFQQEWVHQAEQYLGDKKLSIHIKFDTGMGRIGLKDRQGLLDLLSALDQNRFSINGLFTHYATADEEDLSYYEKQKAEFLEIAELFREYTNDQAIIHADNSAASMRFPENSFDAVRFGISMYGLYPSSYVKQEKPFELRPAFSLLSKLVHVKKVKKGETISYGRTYKAEVDSWVGTIPLGYADGWIRKLQGSDILVEGNRMPIIGRICMDQFMVKLDKYYPVGTEVTLIGKQNNDVITVDEIAKRLDTINYEIPCIIGSRVPRVYKDEEEIVEVINNVLI